MEAAARPSASPGWLVGPALVGAAVAVALGVYGNVHDPTGSSILGDGLFFSATLNMKAWLATAVVAARLRAGAHGVVDVRQARLRHPARVGADRRTRSRARSPS